MSPTICSTMSSIDTMPSVPPYSSITSARWMRVACILASRSIAGIEGGTNSTSRMILVDDSATERSIALRSRPAGNGFLRLVLARADRRVAHHVADHVADVHHADRIVERLVVGDEARMAGAFEHLDQFAERDVALHRDDVGARHHDVVDPAPAQRQDVGQHDALLRREAALAERAVGQHRLQVGARRGLPAEHGAQHAREPAIAAVARRRRVRLRHHGGQVHAFGGSAWGIAATWRVCVRHGRRRQASIACVR